MANFNYCINCDYFVYETTNVYWTVSDHELNSALPPLCICSFPERTTSHFISITILKTWNCVMPGNFKIINLIVFHEKTLCDRSIVPWRCRAQSQIVPCEARILSATMEGDMKRYSSYTRNVKFFLIAAGLWPNVHPILKKTMAFVTFFSTFVIMATVSNFCIKNITNVMILTRGMGLAISFSSAFMKVRCDNLRT